MSCGNRRFYQPPAVQEDSCKTRNFYEYHEEQPPRHFTGIDEGYDRGRYYCHGRDEPEELVIRNA